MKFAKRLKKSTTQLKKVIKKFRKTNPKALMVIIGVLGLSIGVTSFNIFYKKSKPEINNKPATVVKSVSSDTGEEELFLEAVESIKSGLVGTSEIVFGEEKMTLNETFGESSKNFIVVTCTFDIDYSVKLDDINVITDTKEKKVIYQIKKDKVGLNSVTPIGDIEETYSEKSLGTKISDTLSIFNKDKEIKDTAVNRLLSNAKIEAGNYNKEALCALAKENVVNTIKKFNMSNINFEVEIVDEFK